MFTSAPLARREREAFASNGSYLRLICRLALDREGFADSPDFDTYLPRYGELDLTTSTIRHRFWEFPNVVYFVATCLLFARILALTWFEEDAFITFRVVDNFVQGYGLRWNINERVQVYTDPLWMLLHIPVYAALKNIMVTTLLLSWASIIAMMIVVYRTFDTSPLRHAALFVVPFCLSPALTIYSTGGQEQPFTNFLFACAGFVLIQRPKHFWLWLSLITSLSAWTRLDTTLIYGPLWLYFLCRFWRSLPWKQVILGALPLLGWLLFSFVYYGFFTPNTAAAKLSTDLPSGSYVRSGLAYTYDFMLGDPLSALAIVGAVIYFPLIATKRGRRDEDSAVAACIAIGALLYCLYVIRVGGYQLAMRMSTLPAMAALWLWLWRFPSLTTAKHLVLIAGACFLALGLALPHEKRFQIHFIGSSNIRGLFGDFVFSNGKKPLYQYRLSEGRALLDYRIDTGLFLRRPDRTPKPIKVVQWWAIGRGPFFNDGPNTITIDPLAIADPLLSRLPAITRKWAWVGHNDRAIPTGYKSAVETGSTEKMHPALAKYYEKLRLITQGDLWSAERLRTILYFNLGGYDELKRQYVSEAYWSERRVFTP